jgi:hypothetical protein
LGLTAGPVPPRVDACVKAGVLDLIDRAVAHGWSARAACGLLGIDDLRVARWADRRVDGRLDDAAPGGHPLHGLLDWECEAILALHAEWGEVDRSHRKLAHRGSYLERVWVSESTVRKVLAAEGLALQGNPPREPIPRKPWPDWLEWKPNRIWGYDFTHFTRADRAVVAILDVVSRIIRTSAGPRFGDVAGVVFTCAGIGLRLSCHGRHPEYDGSGTRLFAGAVEGGELGHSGVEADSESLDFAEPAADPGFLDARFEIGDDLDQAGPCGRVEPQARAPDARMFVFAAGSVGACAFAEFKLAFLEVALEGAPFLVGGCAVFGGRPFGAALVEEGAVGADQVVVEDRGVGLAGVDVGVPEDPGDDVDRQPGVDGVGGEQPTEVVCGVVQWLTGGVA